MSGVVEAGTVLGLISSIITVIETTATIYKAAKDATGCPKELQVIAEKLPLLETVFRKAELNIDDGRADESSLKKIHPVLQRCRDDIRKLQDIFDDAAPRDRANKLQRIWRAGKAVWKASEIKALWARISDTVDLLEKQKIFDGEDAIVQIKASVEELDRLLGEDGTKYSNTGPGPQNNNVNEGAGTQNITNNTNSGSGPGYFAQTQTFHTGDHHHYVQKIVPNKPRILPRSANPEFVGYDDVLDELRTHILNCNNDDGTATIFVLSGMGGVGKSETVLKFYEKHSKAIDKRFWGVFWIDCGTDTSTEAAFKQISDLCNWAGTSLNNIKNQLASCGKRTLLVLDNCDNDETRYGDCIPNGSHLTVIMTSRLKDSRDYATTDRTGRKHHQALTGMDLEPATNLILSMTIGFQANMHGIKDAEKLANFLERHPLSIQVACSSIREGWCSLDEYVDKFKESFTQHDLFERHTVKSRYDKISSTFEVTAQMLEARSEKDLKARRALQLIEVMSYMHRDNISEEIFESAWQQADFVRTCHDDPEDSSLARLTHWHALQGQGFLGTEDFDQSIRTWRTLCAYLDRLSLIKWIPDTKRVSIHPLIHAWARHRQQDPVETWSTTACILSLATQEDPNWSSLSYTLQPHIENAFEFVYAPIETREVELYKVLYLLVCQLLRVRSSRATQAARTLFLAVKRDGHRELENYESHFSKCAQVLADCLLCDSEYNEAAEMLEQMVKMKEATLSVDYTGHRSLLTFQHSLAIAYQHLGQTSQAVALLEQVVKFLEETLAVSHPDRLASQHELARGYLEQGQVSQAVAMLEHVVKIKEETLAVSHPDRLASQHELARGYQAQGQVSQAVALLEHVVKIKEETLAVSHPDRLASQHELACGYRAQGQVSQAVALLEHVVKIKEETLAVSHPDRLASQHVLACGYLEQGQVNQAVTLLEHVVKIREETLAVSHPDRLASQHVLARGYLEQGQVSQAVTLLEHIVYTEEKTLAVSHPDRLVSQYELARTYCAAGKEKAALKLLKFITGQQAQLHTDYPHRDLIEELLTRLQGNEALKT